MSPDNIMEKLLVKLKAHSRAVLDMKAQSYHVISFNVTCNGEVEFGTRHRFQAQNTEKEIRKVT